MVVQTLKSMKQFQKFSMLFKKVCEWNGNTLAFYFTIIPEQMDIKFNSEHQLFVSGWYSRNIDSKLKEISVNCDNRLPF